MAHEAHEPLRALALDLEHHAALELAQALVGQEERHVDGRDADGHEPLVAHVAGRVKDEALGGEFVVQLLDEGLERGVREGQAELGDLLVEQRLVAQIDPRGGFHPRSVKAAGGRLQASSAAET